MTYQERLAAIGPIKIYGSCHDGARDAVVLVSELYALANEMAAKLAAQDAASEPAEDL